MNQAAKFKTPHQIQSLKKACDSLGIRYQNLDSFSEQILKVSYKNKAFIFGAGNICSFPINSATSTFLAKDKSHTVNVLSASGFNVPEGDYFFLQSAFAMYRGVGKEKQDALCYAKRQGYPLFIKPNDGSRGAFIEKLYNGQDLQNYIDKNQQKLSCVRIEKPLQGHEYRLFVVDGKIWFGYKRRPPFITFDGVQTVSAHLQALMQTQAQYGHSSLSLDSSYIREYLSANQLTLQSIPAKGVTFNFSPAMNIALGGEVVDYSECFSDELNAFTDKIFKLFNLRVFGLDVYSQADDINQAEALTILEINGNPSLESAEKHSTTDIVTRLWAFIIEEIFNHDR
ncbi:hypothetical protein HUZ36_05900 [Pseudoalteromonas sp. McH1-7]|uniref:ATP-grasp domain-containing protein n=1 Tax=Pseudoalteromonas sp. McH1-7 TaxID=2745574 RepID=UPI00159037FB|nr:hypothetical protein [Pseudoalteromonas sp. McH1-7]NUZ10310.1 hypothetical protein [Pseudoalteromonas sp. McH1-7]